MSDNRPEASSRRETLDRPAASDGPKTQDWPRRDSAGSPAELNRRQEALPDGHPSSRYEADGTLRHPPVRLSDLDTGPDEDTQAPDDFTADDVGLLQVGRENTDQDQASRPADIRPFTDAEWADHISEVRDRLGEARRFGLATNLQHTIDPTRRVWSETREIIHNAIIEDLYSKSQTVPCDSRAIMAGGLGGAGKTTILAGHAGIDLSQYLSINPDKVKEEMASRGLVPEVDGLSPMEASDLVHEESSHIAKRLARRAETEGKNIIWDITMASQESTESRIENLRRAGYVVDGIFVDIPIETSIRRADARHREGHSDYLSGVGLGGRYVPPEVIEAQVDEKWGSKNRRTFEEVEHLFDRWARYDNSVDGRPPVLVHTGAPGVTNREEKA